MTFSKCGNLEQYIWHTYYNKQKDIKPWFSYVLWNECLKLSEAEIFSQKELRVNLIKLTKWRYRSLLTALSLSLLICEMGETGFWLGGLRRQVQALNHTAST